MNSIRKMTISDLPRAGFLVGVALGLLLVLLGWLLVPATNPVSVGGVGLVLVIYGLVGWFGFRRIPPEIMLPAGVFALVAGGVFAGEIWMEYALLPSDNTRWGTIEYGAVFAVYFIASLVVAYRRKGLRAGILAALATAILSSVIWLVVMLVTFYVFRSTARQEQVFIAEGNYADFTTSGMHDFNAFVMEDFFGAGAFHLLLGPLVAFVLSAFGGLVGLWVNHIRHPELPAL